MPKRVSRKEPATPLAKRLDAAAERSGLTNEAIAERLGVTAGNVSHWRVGRHAPDVETTQAFARIVGTSDYSLLTGQPDPRPLLAALRVARDGLRQAVVTGEDPSSAWERILGQSDLLTEDERTVLSGGAPALRSYLASVDGVEWIDLTEEEHRLLRDLLGLFSRYRERAGGGTGPDLDPAPAGKTG